MAGRGSVAIETPDGSVAGWTLPRSKHPMDRWRDRSSRDRITRWIGGGMDPPAIESPDGSVAGWTLPRSKHPMDRWRDGPSRDRITRWIGGGMDHPATETPINRLPGWTIPPPKHRSIDCRVGPSRHRTQSSSSVGAAHRWGRRSRFPSGNRGPGREHIGAGDPPEPAATIGGGDDEVGGAGILQANARRDGVVEREPPDALWVGEVSAGAKPARRPGRRCVQCAGGGSAAAARWQ